MKQYKDLVQHVLDNGVKKTDRTGVGTLSVFGWQSRYKMSDGFPLLTLKKTHFHSIAGELIWFLKGDTNIQWLVQNNIKIWNEWPYKKYVETFSKPEGLMLRECTYKGHKGYIKSRDWNDGTLLVLSVPTYEHKAMIVAANSTDLIVNNVMMTEKEFIERIKIDNVFAKQYGDCGKNYSHQWRKFGAYGDFKGVDQIANIVKQIKNNPDSRRLIVSAWNPAEVEDTLLPPCHSFFQFYTVPTSLDEQLNWCREQLYYNPKDFDDQSQLAYMCDKYFAPKHKLSLQMYQRSADIALGVPFNVASYSLLLHMIAQQTNMIADEFVHTLGDAHIYLPHVEAAKEMLIRKNFKLPELNLNKRNSIFDYSIADCMVSDYISHPSIKLSVAV